MIFHLFGTVAMALLAVVTVTLLYVRGRNRRDRPEGKRKDGDMFY